MNVKMRKAAQAWESRMLSRPGVAGSLPGVTGNGVGRADKRPGT